MYKGFTELTYVLIKALAKAPADRYQAMDDFARTLEMLLVRVVSEEPALPTKVAADPFPVEKKKV